MSGRPLKQKLIYEDGFTVVHFTGTTQSDYALCGQDLAGDNANYDGHGGYGVAEATYSKVDCKDCIRIVSYCKSIDRRHLNP